MDELVVGLGGRFSVADGRCRQHAQALDAAMTPREHLDRFPIRWDDPYLWRCSEKKLDYAQLLFAEIRSKLIFLANNLVTIIGIFDNLTIISVSKTNHV